MIRADDFTGQLQEYLDEFEGFTPLPNDLRDAIRAELALTPQRPPWWPTRRFPDMNNFAKLTVAAAAVVVAALLGFNYLLAPNVGGPSVGDATPSPSPVPTPSPSPVPALSGQGDLSPGRYQADPALPMDVTIEVPAGWSAGGSWVVRGPNGNDAPDGMAIRFYTAANIYNDPLVLSDGPLNPPVGPSVDGLVAALVGHPDWNVTGTDPITMDGYAGQVVHVTLPEETSEGNRFYLFRDGYGGQVYGWDPNQAFDIYIVDVAGERLIIEAFQFSATSESDVAARDAVLASIQIEAAP